MSKLGSVGHNQTHMRTNLSELDLSGVERSMSELGVALGRVDPAIADWARQYGRGHVQHYASLLQGIGRIANGGSLGRVVDIGSVPGHVTAILKYRGVHVEAVDIKPGRAQGLFEALDIPFHEVDVENETLPFAGESVDLVIFSEILEHLRTNPFQPVREAYRVLRRGGSMLLSTPRITPLMRWRFLWGHDYNDDLIDQFAKLETLGHMGHFRLYSENEVRRILDHTGFEIVDRYTGGKVNDRDNRIDARLLRKFTPGRMNAQLYVWARK